MAGEACPGEGRGTAIRGCAVFCCSSHGWLRFQPDSALSCWFVERTGGAKGSIRKIMVVALARKLLVALWRYVETGEVPAGARLAAA